MPYAFDDACTASEGVGTLKLVHSLNEILLLFLIMNSHNDKESADLGTDHILILKVKGSCPFMIWLIGVLTAAFTSQGVSYRERPLSLCLLKSGNTWPISGSCSGSLDVFRLLLS